MSQIQVQLSKLKVLENQSFSNNIMLNAIAALEDLAISYGFIGQKFGFYSGYAQRDEKELINAVILQLILFRNSYANYFSVYGEYNFPNNLNKNQVMEFIQKLRTFVITRRPDSTIYFDEFLGILKGQPILSNFSQIAEGKKREWRNTTEADILRFGRNVPLANTHMFNQSQNIQNEYNTTGNYKIMANLGKKREDNENMNNLNKLDKDFNSKVKQFEKIENDIELLLVQIYKNDSHFTDDEMLKIKGQINLFKNLIKYPNLSEDKINEKIIRYQTSKTQLNEVFKDKSMEVINFINNIYDDLIECYRSKSNNK